MTPTGRATLSVCIPTCNGARHIEAAVTSALRSASAPDEVVVQDDGSDDDTVARVEALADPRIRLEVNRRRLGVPANWNRAVERSTGDLVALLNHDDLLRPFWLTFAAHSLARHPSAAWVTTAFDVVDAEERPTGRIQRFPDSGLFQPAAVFPVVARLDGLGPFVVVRRDVFHSLGGYDEQAGPGADNDLYLRLAARHPMVYSSQPHAAWRVHSDNLSRRWAPVNQAREGFRMLTRLFDDPALDPALAALREEVLADYARKTLAHLDRLRRARRMADADVLEAYLHSWENRG